MASSTPASPSDSKLKYESMTHPVLVGQCKKQIVLLQKLKGRCDQLQKKINEQSDYNQIKESLKKMQSDSESLEVDYEAIKLSESEIRKENRSLTEDVECLKKKEETLMLTLQALQSDNQGLEEDHLRLKNDLKKHQSEKDEFFADLLKMKEEKQKLEENLNKLQSENLFVDKMRSVLLGSDEKIEIEEVCEMVMKLKDQFERSKQENEDLKKNLFEFKEKQKSHQKEEISSNIEASLLREKLAAENCLKESHDQVEKLVYESREVEEEKNSLKSKIEMLKKQLNEVQTNSSAENSKKIVQMEEEVSVSIQKQKDLQESLDKYVLLNENLEKENNQFKLKIKDLEEKIVNLKVCETKNEQSTDDKSIELKKALDEKENFNIKLKTLAVKTKKELTIAKQKVQTLQDENTTLSNKNIELEKHLLETRSQANTVQIMQNEYDNLHDKLDLKNEEKNEVQKMLDEVTQKLSVELNENEKLKSELYQVKNDFEKIKAVKKDCEKSLATLSNSVSKQEKEIEASNIEKSTLRKEIERLKSEADVQVKRLGSNDEELKEMKNILKDSQKEIHKKEMLELKVKQFEVTVNELHQQIDQSEKEVEDLKKEDQMKKTEISKLTEEKFHLQQELVEVEESLKKSLKKLETRNEEMKHLQQVESDLQTEIQQMSDLVNQLQLNFDQKKTELSTKSSHYDQLNDQLQSFKEESLKTSESLKREITDLEQKLKESLEEKQKISLDYENYKIRAHSVLKQQKSKESNEKDVKTDQREIQAHLQEIERLRSRLSQSQSTITSRDNELDILQSDYDSLLRQQQESSDNSVEREKRWKARVKSLQQEVICSKKDYSTDVERLKEQHKELLKSREDDLKKLKIRFKDAEENSLKIIEEKEDEINKLHLEIRSSKDVSSEATSASKPAHTSSTSYSLNRHSSFHHHDVTHDDVRMMKREEGEGEENPDYSSVMSFEKLIEGPGIKSVKVLSDTESVSSEVMMKQLETKLDLQSRRLQHLSEVARENESNSARLTEQNRVLKDEIRRLERNETRSTSLASLEYLKNIIIKFILLPPSDERCHLLPVIDKMLQLTSEEKDQLAVVAQGEPQNESQTSWGSYLPRWNGI